MGTTARHTLPLERIRIESKSGRGYFNEPERARICRRIRHHGADDSQENETILILGLRAMQFGLAGTQSPKQAG